MIFHSTSINLEWFNFTNLPPLCSGKIISFLTTGSIFNAQSRVMVWGFHCVIQFFTCVKSGCTGLGSSLLSPISPAQPKVGL